MLWAQRDLCPIIYCDMVPESLMVFLLLPFSFGVERHTKLINWSLAGSRCLHRLLKLNNMKYSFIFLLNVIYIYFFYFCQCFKTLLWLTPYFWTVIWEEKVTHWKRDFESCVMHIFPDTMLKDSYSATRKCCNFRQRKWTGMSAFIFWFGSVKLNVGETALTPQIEPSQ